MAPVFVLDRGLIRHGSTEVRLTAAQAAILGLLHKRRGQRITVARLALVIWPTGTPPHHERSVYVQIHWLRRKTAGMPIRIETDPTRTGEGYRLVGEIEVI